MFTRKTAEPTKLETTIDELFNRMALESPDSEEYAAMADQMTKLYKLKEVDSNISSRDRVSKDTWAIIAANLAGIMVIISYERTHVMTSKALGFVRKLF